MKVKITLLLMLSLCGMCRGKAELKAKNRWIDPRFKKISKEEYLGEPVKLKDGGLLRVVGNGTRVSKDDGKTWSKLRPIYTGPGPGIPKGGASLMARDGVLVLIYGDMSTFRFAWHNEKGEPADDAQLDVWSIRSLDEGKTWVDRQMIYDGYCGAFQGLLQTRSGHVVIPIQRMVRNPGRNVTCTYVSRDNGKTWTRSNIIDLGGNGHHDGAFEATMIELNDGRLWMLLRTNWGRFWEAFSDDHGYSWRTIRPSNIDASSSPGHLLRLSSGRIMLLWNRLYPEGETFFAPYGDRTYADRAVSWHREELSIAFTENEGKTWSKPIMVAREKSVFPKDARIAYPRAYERRPGLLHIYTIQGKLRVSAIEDDLIQ